VKKGELYSLENKDEGFLTQLRLGKSYLHGIDVHERPICLVRTRLHHSADQQPEAIERFTVWEMETARLMLKGNIDTACVVFDMTGFTVPPSLYLTDFS
jgi:CRAL/TRIO domain